MYAENWHQVFERNQVSVPMEGLFIKEKDILKSCYWNFLLYYSSSKEMVKIQSCVLSFLQSLRVGGWGFEKLF